MAAVFMFRSTSQREQSVGDFDYLVMVTVEQLAALMHRTSPLAAMGAQLALRL